jgi:hypothetical protein
VSALENSHVMDNILKKSIDNSTDWSPGLIFYSINHLKVGELGKRASSEIEQPSSEKETRFK